MSAEQSLGLRDRLSERETLGRLLRDARSGQARCWSSAARRASASRRCCATPRGRRPASGSRRSPGVESEMELPFAGLHQLCAPMLDRLDALPAAAAGRAARRVRPGVRRRPRTASWSGSPRSACCPRSAEERPLLCVVDDAQWLDDASAPGPRVRRPAAAGGVGGDRVRGARARATSRELGGPAGAARSTGLDDEDARALLATVIPGRLDERVRDRIVAETRGNPLALLELPRGLTAAQLAGGFGLPDAAPLSGRIEESFLRRLDALPADTRLLLLVAAAEPVGDPALVWRAAERLGIAGTALEPAARTGLLEIGAQVRFRHPLVRSAVYRSASAAERRACTRRWPRPPTPRSIPIAAPGTGRRPRRARRGGRRRARALGRPGAGARRARRGGGVPAARRRPDGRPGRGAPSACSRRRRPTCRPARSTRRSRCWRRRRPGRWTSSSAPAWTCCAPRSRSPRAAAATLRGCCSRAAQALEPLDVRLVARHVPRRVGAALFAGRAGERRRPARGLAGRAAAPAPARPPRPSDLLLDGFALAFTDGRAAAAPVLRARGHRLRRRRGLGRGSAAAGAGWRPWRPSTCGTTTRCLAVADPRRSSSPASGRARGPAVGAQRARPGARARRRVRAGGAADRRGGGGHARRPARSSLRTARWCSRRFRGDEAEASMLIERDHRGRDRAAARASAVQFAHYAKAVLMQRPRPLRGGARARPRGERRHAGARRLDVGAERAGRGGRQDAGHRARGTALARLAEHAQAHATPTGRWASRRAAARC